MRCEACHAEKLVAFSCKKRGFDEHIVWAKVQAELAFGCGEYVKDGAVVRAVLRYHMTEEDSSGGVQEGAGHPATPTFKRS